MTILLIAALAAACSAGAALAPAPGGDTGGAPAAGPGGGNLDGDGTGGGLSGGEDQGQGSGNGQGDRVVFAAGQEGLLIIKNGSMALQVTSIDAAVGSANQLVAGLGGYASGSDRSGDGESAQATITYRIPATRWEEALTGLRALAEKLLAERSSTDDVTSQVVDLGARIRNLQATETALQAIMDRAVDIEDVLKVQAELTTVRGQIEQLTSQKTSLEQQAAFSTLTLTFALKPNPILTEQQGFDPASEVDAASASLVGVLQGLATAGIWFGIVWLPILLALAIIGGIIVMIVRRLAPRVTSGAAPAAPAAGGEA